MAKAKISSVRVSYLKEQDFVENRPFLAMVLSTSLMVLGGIISFGILVLIYKVFVPTYTVQHLFTVGWGNFGGIIFLIWWGFFIAGNLVMEFYGYFANPDKSTYWMRRTKTVESFRYGLLAPIFLINITRYVRGK